MHRFFGVAAFAVGISLAGSANAHRTISVTRAGRDLAVVVHGVTDYCSSDASLEIIRKEDTIRIVRDRPTRVSRCVAAQDVSVIIRDVPAGTYRLTYEQIPYVAPARALTLAS